MQEADNFRGSGWHIGGLSTTALTGTPALQSRMPGSGPLHPLFTEPDSHGKSADNPPELSLLGIRTATPPLQLGNLTRGKASQAARGFTLVELLIVLAIIMTISAMAVPNLQAAMDDARVARAVADIRSLETDIEAYEIENGQLPNSLADFGDATVLDPWGSPYQYLNFANTKGKGAMRKDRFLVPLNTDYDLYSKGKNGESIPPITAKVSQDDILRANDGSFIGLASTY